VLVNYNAPATDVPHCNIEKLIIRSKKQTS